MYMEDKVGEAAHLPPPAIDSSHAGEILPPPPPPPPLTLPPEEGAPTSTDSPSISSSPSSSSTSILSSPVHPRLRVVFSYLLLHAMSVGMLVISVPTLLLRSFNDDSSKAAFFNSAFSAVTAAIGLVWYPLLGMLSDHYGRKPFILWSLMGSIMAFSLLALFSNLGALITVSIIRGFTDVAYTMSYAVLGDVTDQPAFIRTYGKLMAAGGLGILLGPMWALASESIEKFHLPFVVAAVISFINLLQMWSRFEETLHLKENEARRAAMEEEVARAIEAGQASVPITPSRLDPAPIMRESLRELYHRRTLNPFKALLILRGTRALWGLALALFFNMTSFSGMMSVLFLFTKERFGWRSAENAAFVVVFGCVNIFANLVTLPRLLRHPRIKEQGVLTLAMGCTLASLILWSVVPANGGWILYIGVVFLQPSFFLMSTIRAMLSRQIPPARQGELQGALTCITSLSSIVGPLAVNGVFGAAVAQGADVYFPGAPFVLCICLQSACAVCLWYVWRGHLGTASSGYMSSPTHEPHEHATSFPTPFSERMVPPHSSPKWPQQAQAKPAYSPQRGPQRKGEEQDVHRPPHASPRRKMENGQEIDSAYPKEPSLHLDSSTLASSSSTSSEQAEELYKDPELEEMDPELSGSGTVGGEGAVGDRHRYETTQEQQLKE